MNEEEMESMPYGIEVSYQYLIGQMCREKGQKD